MDKEVFGAVANNIYDLAGNVCDLTMLSNGTGRVSIGFSYVHDLYSANNMYTISPHIQGYDTRMSSNVIYKIRTNKKWKVTKVNSNFPLLQLK